VLIMWTKRLPPFPVIGPDILEVAISRKAAATGMQSAAQPASSLL
jgi:hypothetical protein